jgi:hypothetical protein
VGTALDCTGLHWTALDCTGLHWTALDFTGLHWTGELSSKKDNCVGISIFYWVQIYKYIAKERICKS